MPPTPAVPKAPITQTDADLDSAALPPVPGSGAALPPFPVGGDAADKSDTTKKDDVSDTWTCPICADSLGSNQAEIGALTQEGKRIEHALYHMGCVSAMFIHGLRQGNANIIGRGSGKEVHTISPVTRKAVNGFLPMPAITDRTKWIEFIDWKGDGLVRVADLMEVCVATLLIDSSALSQFLRDILGCEGDLVDMEITTIDVTEKVMPYLEDQCAKIDLKRQERMAAMQQPWNELQVSRLNVEPKSFTEALMNASRLSASMRFLAKDIGCRMQTVCKPWRALARALLIRETFCMLNSGPMEGGRRSQHSKQRSKALVQETASEWIARRWKQETGASVEDGPSPGAPVDSRQLEITIAGARLLGLLVEPMDKRAIESAYKLMADSRPEAVEQGTKLLAQLVGKGDQRALDSLNAKLKCSSALVRKAAVTAIGHIAKKGDSDAIHSLAGIVPMNLNLGTCAVSMAAMDALKEVAAKGDERVVRTLLSHLSTKSRDADMASFTMNTLAQVANKGDRRVIQACIPFLEFEPSACDWVRKTALRSLALLTDRDDTSTVKKVALRLKDKNQAVRVVAFRSLACIVQQADSQIVKQFLCGLNDESSAVRKAALEALPDVTHRCDSRVVVKIVPMLLDNDALVREAAAIALGSLADYKDKKTLRTLADLLSGCGKCSKEANADVRCAIQRSIEQIESSKSDSVVRHRSLLCGLCRKVETRV